VVARIDPSWSKPPSASQGHHVAAEANLARMKVQAADASGRAVRGHTSEEKET